jgi:hypothetical protein
MNKHWDVSFRSTTEVGRAAEPAASVENDRTGHRQPRVHDYPFARTFFTRAIGSQDRRTVFQKRIVDRLVP